MFKQGIEGVDFAICNTDNQAMNISPVPVKIQLGPSLTEGRGAGSKPVVGREACNESIDEIRQFLSHDTKMLFVTAGMGGGTGTGAAPVIAKTAREMDILTVGIVTTPFVFEGRRRMKQAEEGIAEMKKNVDTLVIISNDKLRQIYGNLSLVDAFTKADDILTVAAKGIADIITQPGYVNVDFEDVNTVMRDSGVAVMGTAAIAGEERALRAVEAALQSPLLEDNDIRGAQHILLNITSGTQAVTMDELSAITEYVQAAAGEGTDLIWGNCYDETLGEKICVTVIATGFETGRNKEVAPSKITAQYSVSNNSNKNSSYFSPAQQQQQQQQQAAAQPKVTRVSLDDDDFGADKKKDKYAINPPIQADRTPPFQQKQPETQQHANPIKEVSKEPNVKLDDPETLSELESQPAFLRKGIRLKDPATFNRHSTPPSEE